MHLLTELTAESRVLEPFGEVGEDVPLYFSIMIRFINNDAIKSYLEKLVLKQFSWIFLDLA